MKQMIALLSGLNTTRLIISGLLIASTGGLFGQGAQIVSERVSSLPIRDVNHHSWQTLTPATVKLLPQNVTNPKITTPTVNEITVRSQNDGTRIAVMVEWKDPSRNSIVDVDAFCDQAAIQFPYDLTKAPNFMMGNKDGRVYILHWKASWQDDIEKGFRDVKDAYPNYWTDIYPMMEGKSTTQTVIARDIRPDQITDPQAKNYMHGAYAGNPMSIFNRKDPSEECVAEGFGTLTTRENQEGTAWGVWSNGVWRVIYTRKLKLDDNASAIVPEKTKIGFAVWEGSAENIGSRKNYAMWTDLIIKQ
jgi:hypothetical protein